MLIKLSDGESLSCWIKNLSLLFRICFSRPSVLDKKAYLFKTCIRVQKHQGVSFVDYLRARLPVSVSSVVVEKRQADGRVAHWQVG